MEVLNQYAKASNDGVIGENVAERLLSCEVSPAAPIDLILPDGMPVEVKACARWIGTAHTSTGRRRGRFVFMASQHRRLIHSGGYYLLVLLESSGAVARVKTVPAEDIFHPSIAAGTEKVCINWQNLMRNGEE